jgi:hypothetical protein
MTLRNGAVLREDQDSLLGSPAIRDELFIRFGDLERLVISEAFAEDLLAA